MPGLGDELRAAREARGLSLSDVSEKIHIRSLYLKNIEDEDWATLVAPVYVRGFVRTYARFLGIDPEGAVERFNAAVGGDREPSRPVATAAAASSLPKTAGRTGPSPWLWATAVIALVLVGFVGYNYYQLQTAGAGSGGVPVAANSAGPVLASPPPATAVPKATPAPRRTLEVRVTQRSWLLVQVDGAEALEGIFPPGTHRAFHGKSALVRAGNAGGVDVSVNGRDVGTMGPSGDVVEKTFALAQD